MASAVPVVLRASGDLCRPSQLLVAWVVVLVAFAGYAAAILAGAGSSSSPLAGFVREWVRDGLLVAAAALGLVAANGDGSGKSTPPRPAQGSLISDRFLSVFMLASHATVDVDRANSLERRLVWARTAAASSAREPARRLPMRGREP
jgi:hypothetical protein